MRLRAQQFKDQGSSGAVSYSTDPTSMIKAKALRASLRMKFANK